MLEYWTLNRAVHQIAHTRPDGNYLARVNVDIVDVVAWKQIVNYGEYAPLHGHDLVDPVYPVVAGEIRLCRANHNSNKGG